MSFYSVGHFAFYNNIGRIEVPPVPTDKDGAASGIRYRFGFYPFLEPSALRGYGMVRQRHIDPKIEDNVWVYNPATRKLRRESADVLSDSIGALPGFSGGAGGGGGGFGAGAGGMGSSGGSAYANTLDPDSYFGFSAKIEDFNYRFLGEKEMLASVHAEHSPEVQCPYDGGKTICPEDWEMRHLYVIEAIAKPGRDLTIQKRIFYIDSEGWFITASDQYDRRGQAVEDNRDFQHVSRPAGAGRENRHLSVQADIPVGPGGRRSRHRLQLGRLYARADRARSRMLVYRHGNGGQLLLRAAGAGARGALSEDGSRFDAGQFACTLKRMSKPHKELLHATAYRYTVLFERAPEGGYVATIPVLGREIRCGRPGPWPAMRFAD